MMPETNWRTEPEAFLVFTRAVRDLKAFGYSHEDLQQALADAINEAEAD